MFEMFFLQVKSRTREKERKGKRTHRTHHPLSRSANRNGKSRAEVVASCVDGSLLVDLRSFSRQNGRKHAKRACKFRLIEKNDAPFLVAFAAIIFYSDALYPGSLAFDTMT